MAFFVGHFRCQSTKAPNLKNLWLADQNSFLEDTEVCNLISGLPFDAVKAAANKAMNNGSTEICMMQKLESTYRRYPYAD